MAEIWPSGVPHLARAGTFKLIEPYRSPLATEMDDGPERTRRATTKNIAKVQFTIRMSNAQFSAFKAFVRDGLVDGTAPFVMPVWTGAAVAERTCRLQRGTYQADVAPNNVDTFVTLSLDVEDW